MTRLADALAAAGVVSIGLDTSPIIYFVEAHPQYDALVEEIFQQITQGQVQGVTSTISLMEVLIRPIREGNLSLQKRYRDLLLESVNFRTVDIDVAVAECAASLRSRYNLKTPDSLQIAVAITSGCEVFLTNDSDLRRVIELQILLLSELEL